VKWAWPATVIVLGGISLCKFMCILLRCIAFICVVSIVTNTCAVLCSTFRPRTGHEGTQAEYRSADKSLAQPGRKQATATEDFGVHTSYL
jgi:uncharacterized protein YceK